MYIRLSTQVLMEERYMYIIPVDADGSVEQYKTISKNKEQLEQKQKQQRKKMTIIQSLKCY